MLCHLVNVEGTAYACTNTGCGRIVKIERRKPSSLKVKCKGTVKSKQLSPEVEARAREIGLAVVNKGEPPSGPGEEFRKLTNELEIDPSGCPCADTQRKMNRLGVAGCREQLDELCAEILANASKWKIDDPETLQRAALKAIELGLVIDPADPVRSLVLIAIERAEKVEADAVSSRP